MHKEDTSSIQYHTRKKLGWARWLLFIIGKPVKTRESVLHTTPWLTRGMIAIISLISIIAWFSPGASHELSALVFRPDANGIQWLLGMAGCAFLHAGWAHLIGNMYFLWLFGRNVECRFGRRRMLGLFFISTALGAVIHGMFSDAPLVGASGGIFGVLVVYALLFPKARILWLPYIGYILRFVALRTEKILSKRFIREGMPVRFFLGIYILFQFILLYQQIYADGNVSALGHLGGGLAGVLIFYSWKYKWLP